MSIKKSKSIHKSGKGRKPPLVGHKYPGRASVHPDTAKLEKKDEEPKPWVNHYALNKGL